MQSVLKDLWVIDGKHNQRLVELERELINTNIELVNFKKEFYEMGSFLFGLIEYLNLAHKKEWEIDQSYPDPLPHKREVIKFYKKVLK